MNPREQSELYTGTVGLPLPSTEISIRDDAGQELDIGEPGELCVRGPQLMQGYWQRPEATRESFYEDGFLRTGDIATVDQGGDLRIVDRAKDMILVSGFNVYPNEVEEVLAAHAATRGANGAGSGTGGIPSGALRTIRSTRFSPPVSWPPWTSSRAERRSTGSAGRAGWSSPGVSTPSACGRRPIASPRTR